MKEQLKKYLLFTLMVYVAVYLFRSFVIFDFRNPFQWVLDIPNYSNDNRALILTCYVTYSLVVNIYIYISKDEKKTI